MMTKRSMGRLAIAAILGVFGLASSARAQEAEIPVDQVPKAVTDSAKSKFPGAKIREASKETEDGKTVYELELTHENRKKDVSFLEDGTLVVVEAEVTGDEIPAAAKKAVTAKYPGAKINLVESVKKGPRLKTEADYYEFHLTTAGKKSVEVEVNGDGKILKSEDNDEKEEKDEKD